MKIGVPNRELTSEINTLRLYNGQGACRILEADAGCWSGCNPGQCSLH